MINYKSQFLSMIYFLINDTYRKMGIKNLYYKYMDSQYYSRESIEAMQTSKLRALLREAYLNIPYYREFLGNENINLSEFNLSDLHKLPILTKKILQEQANDLINYSLPKSRFIKNSTSGSSGSSTYFYSDKAELPYKIALNMRQNYWMGIDQFSKQLWIWGRSFKSKINKWRIIKDRIKGKITISSYNLSDSDIKLIINLCNKFRPKLIGAYPSHLYLIALQDEKIKYFPKAISLSGEMLYDFQRKQIESFFEAPVYNYYGARDGGMIAQECKEHNGLHIFSENVIVEVLDDNDQPIKEGIGRIILTLLHNYAMPLIRYEIGDMAEIDNTMWEKCECGVTLPRIKRIIGRTFDLITFPNGNKVGGTFWTLLMRSIEDVDRFQVYQDNIGHIKITYTSKSINDIDKNLILKKIYEYGGKNTFVEMERVNYLEDRASVGKYQFVKSDYSK